MLSHVPRINATYHTGNLKPGPTGFLIALLVLACITPGGWASGEEGSGAGSGTPVQVHASDLIAYPPPWNFELGKASVSLVSDRELEILATEPDRAINLGVTDLRMMKSLRQVCEESQRAGQPTIAIGYDSFYATYRKDDIEIEREWSIESQKMIDHLAAISRFAEPYGLGLEISLLSPSAVGESFVEKTGESGKWMQYRKAMRDPETGAFSVELWRQEVWGGHLGSWPLELDGIRVFAFKAPPLLGTPYRFVDPDGIVEISEVAEVEILPGLRREIGHYNAQRVRIHGAGRTDIGPLDTVLVVQVYRTREMDYFSPHALPFLNSLVDRYADAGVRVNGIYSDELMIQGDGVYFSHGEFALRYVSDGLAERYAELYGERYADFAKYLIYFVYDQEEYANLLNVRMGTMHTFDSSPRGIRETALFRARYYHLLQDGVVDLLTKAKHHGEKRFGHQLDSRAHATWAESPTTDEWATEAANPFLHKYEYTPNFIASFTVHQAVSACYDYFKWGDFLTGNGTDHAEGGFLDRDYWGLALACSMGVINEVPYSYAAGWGMPALVSERYVMLANTYGVFACLYGGVNPYGAVQETQHRDIDILMLYPIDLVAAEERFGSWMTQYGYANTITQAKLLELGKVVDGRIELCGRTFSTLVATFEPFPSTRLLEMFKTLAEGGGRIVWSGPPPLVTAEGGDAMDQWRKLFGTNYVHGHNTGIPVPGTQIRFEGNLEGVATQTILTDFIVDRVHPIGPLAGTEVVAWNGKYPVATHRPYPGGGSATFLGYRPRDDQSKSLGYETRNWFEVLEAIGAYPATGAFPDLNDNTEVISRTTDMLATRFPEHFDLILEGQKPGSRGDTIAFEKQNNTVVFQIHPMNWHNARWIYVRPPTPQS